MFGHQSTPVNLKNELKKVKTIHHLYSAHHLSLHYWTYQIQILLFSYFQLLNGSRELIDLNFGPSESLGLAKQISRESEQLKRSRGSGDVYDTDVEEVGITYEQMQCIIESVLIESNYYDVRQRHTAVSPPGAVDSFLAKHHGGLGSAWWRHWSPIGEISVTSWRHFLITLISQPLVG